MRKMLVFVLAVLSLLIPAVVSAQDVPDLSNSWKLTEEKNVSFGAKMPDGSIMIVSATAKYFFNESKNSWASVLMWDRIETAMLFEDDTKTEWMALKSGGKWYRAKEPGFVLKAVVVVDKSNKPKGVILSLDTVDGEKTLNLSF